MTEALLLALRRAISAVPSAEWTEPDREYIKENIQRAIDGGIGFKNVNENVKRAAAELFSRDAAAVAFQLLEEHGVSVIALKPSVRFIFAWPFFNLHITR